MGFCIGIWVRGMNGGRRFGPRCQKRSGCIELFGRETRLMYGLRIRGSRNKLGGSLGWGPEPRGRFSIPESCRGAARVAGLANADFFEGLRELLFELCLAAVSAEQGSLFEPIGFRAGLRRRSQA
jgi:hypothetical protein